MKKKLIFPLFNLLVGALLDGPKVIPDEYSQRMLAFFEAAIEVSP